MQSPTVSGFLSYLPSYRLPLTFSNLRRYADETLAAKTFEAKRGAGGEGAEEVVALRQAEMMREFRALSKVISALPSFTFSRLLPPCPALPNHLCRLVLACWLQGGAPADRADAGGDQRARVRSNALSITFHHLLMSSITF